MSDEAPLSVKETLFVGDYVKTGNAVQSMVHAGWSPGYARKSASAILRRPRVAAAIEKVRKQLEDDTGYDLRAAYKEVCELLTEARVAKQLTAASSLYTTKVKLFGLLVDKMRLQVDAKPSLVDAIADARGRAGLPPVSTPLMIDITPKTADPFSTD